MSTIPWRRARFGGWPGHIAVACAMVFASISVGCDGGSPSADRTSAPAATGSTLVPGPKVQAPAPGAEPAGEPVCTRSDRRVWSADANARTGLTATGMPDGSSLVGVAVGDVPHVLTIAADGTARLTKLELQKGSVLTKPLVSPDGVRHLQRVTAAAGGRAFADYRDKQADGHRRIACGPTDGPPVLMYDGMPLLPEVDSSGRGAAAPATPTPTAAPAAAGTAVATATAQASASSQASSSDGPNARFPRPTRVADAKAGKAPAVAKPAAEPESDGTIRELRDCRTFTDPTGKDVWGVGTELVGSPHADGSIRWKMVFYVAAEAGARRETLHEVVLGREPDKLYTLEAPVARKLSSGSYVLAGRYRGAMFAWMLEPDKSPRGSLMRYTGGYPSLPRIVADGPNHWLLTSLQVDASQWKLRAMQVTGAQAKLLATLTEPRLGAAADSMAEPSFARVGDQRWLAYHQGERRRGAIVVVPVGDDLHAEGRQFTMETPDASVYESMLFPLKDGKLMVLYIQRREGAAAELVSEVLSCDVKI